MKKQKQIIYLTLSAIIIGLIVFRGFNRISYNKNITKIYKDFDIIQATPVEYYYEEEKGGLKYSGFLHFRNATRIDDTQEFIATYTGKLTKSE